MREAALSIYQEYLSDKVCDKLIFKKPGLNCQIVGNTDGTLLRRIANQKAWSDQYFLQSMQKIGVFIWRNSYNSAHTFLISLPKQQ